MYYTAIIKEFFTEQVLKPSYRKGVKMTAQELIDIWGLNEPDIEWYELYEVDELTGVKNKIGYKK